MTEWVSIVRVNAQMNTRQPNASICQDRLPKTPEPSRVVTADEPSRYSPVSFLPVSAHRGTRLGFLR